MNEPLPDKKFQVLRRQRPWRTAYYYLKADSLYRMTYVFCQRFLPAYGDRTVDQMDYRDYLHTRNLPVWDSTHPRYTAMQTFCRNNNKAEDYEPYLKKWDDEEMANTALTLCYQTDNLLHNELKRLEADFVKEGGIKERMHAARTGYRKAEMEELAALRQEVARLRAENEQLRKMIEGYRGG